MQPFAGFLAALSGAVAFGVAGLQRADAAPAPPDGATVRLTLSNPAGTAVRRWPVSIGVPFPAGALKTPSVSLADNDGAPVPVQTRVLARWWGRDNSVSALLVTFTADTRHPHYDLRLAPPASAPAAGRALTVEAADGVVTVTTGPLRAVLREKAFNVLDQVHVDLDGDGAFAAAEAVLKPGGGQLFAGDFGSRLADAKLTVEETGPIRAVIKAEGACRNKEGQHLVSYLFRFRFYAGAATVQADCTIIQDSDEVFVDIPSLGIELPLQLRGRRQATFSLEADKLAKADLEPGASASLLQLGPEQKETINGTDRPGMSLFLDKVKPYWSEKEKGLWERDERIKTFSFSLTRGAETLASGDRASGILQVTAADSPFAFSAGLRWFWQLHPKGVALEGDSFRLLLWPEHEKRGPLDLHRGTAKTHSFCLSFGRRDQADAGLAACRAFLDPPLWFPSPQQFRNSMLWGDLFPREQGKFGYYEERAAKLNSRQQRSTENLAGMLNFGDEGQGAGWWNNMETALDHAMFAQFARTGDRDMHDSFIAAVNHFRDVDVHHVEHKGVDYGIWLNPGYLPRAFARKIAADPEMRRNTFWYDDQPNKGGVYRHSFRHRGNAAGAPYSLDSSRVAARGMFYSGTCEVGGHGWMVGLVDHYLLTGDRRSLEVAETVGGYMLKHHSLGIGRDNWKNINLVALYKATGDEAYKKPVLEAVDYIYEQREQMANRALKDSVMSPFYTILVFFRHLHLLTGDPELARKFVDCVDCMLKYETYAETGRGQVWERVHAYRDSRYHGDFADLAYAYRLTGDRSYVDKGLSTFRLYMQAAYHSTFGYEAPIYLSALDKLGIDALNEPFPACGGRRAYWVDATDRPGVIYAFQGHSYRAPVGRSKTGRISVTSPNGKLVAEAAATLGGFNFYRLEIPSDGERGTYKITVTDPPANSYLSFSAEGGELLDRPPSVKTEGRHGPGALLKDMATMRLPVSGNLRREEGTVELWFKPLWTSPAQREEDVPYHYNVLFDSRSPRYSYGFYLSTFDSGKKGASKSLGPAWAGNRQAHGIGGLTLDWPEPKWRHIAFSWKKTEGKAVGFFFIDGKQIARTETDGAKFPDHLHPEILLGANSTLSKNTSLDGVVDAVRISGTMKTSMPPDPVPALAPDTLFLTDMSLESWFALEQTEDGKTPDKLGRARTASVHGTTAAPGKRGAAMRFNGRDSHVAVPLTEFAVPETPTWSAWVRPDHVKGCQTVAASGSYGHFNLVIDQGRPCLIAFVRWGTGKGFIQAKSETPIPAGEWSHVGGSFDGRVATVFVNGVPRGRAELAPGRTGVVRPPPQSGPDMRIGAGYPGYTDTRLATLFAGCIDEVKLYNRPFTAADFRTMEGCPPAAE